MNETIEALLTTDAFTSGRSLFTCCVWDINTGTVIHSYKNGGICSSNTLCQINNDYILSGEHLKPLLHLWPVNSQEPVGKSAIRLVLPGNVSALDVSTNGMYCAAGIDEKLYIWQLATGRLLAVISKHFQPITKVLFSNDGSYVITAGNDSLVLIWSVAHLIVASQQHNELLIAQSIAGQSDPIHTISDHSMPIKDMYLGKSGARLVTVSTDRTMKLYDFIAGQMLISVVFDVCLTSVLLNKSETLAYVGTASGEIFELGFLNPPRHTKEYHFSSSSSDQNKLQNKNNFIGHNKSVTCLTMTIDNKILVSGSVDEQVIVWHIDTKQKLRVIPHKGPVTNVHFMVVRKNLFHHEFKASTVVQSFDRSKNTETDVNEFIQVIHTTDKQLLTSTHINQEYNESIIHCNSIQGNDVNFQDQINQLKTVNAKLYKFALDNILDKVANNKQPVAIEEETTNGSKATDKRKRKL